MNSYEFVSFEIYVIFTSYGISTLLLYLFAKMPNELRSMKSNVITLDVFRLHGSYEAIEGGQTMDALVDLMGGLAERYEIKGTDPNMYRHLRIAHKSGAFIARTREVVFFFYLLKYMYTL